MVLHKFMVYAPDCTDDDALNRRLAVREKHLADAKVMQEEGFVIRGGPLLSPESIASEEAPKKMIGSIRICQAESLEACTKKTHEDVYYTAGVWDKEKLVILPVLW